MTIVGVVKDHKYRSIDEEPFPMAWYMYAQIPMIGKMDVEMRVHGEPLAILPAARKAVQQMDPDLPLIQSHDPARTIRSDHLQPDALRASCRILWPVGGGRWWPPGSTVRLPIA